MNPTHDDIPAETTSGRGPSRALLTLLLGSTGIAAAVILGLRCTGEASPDAPEGPPAGGSDESAQAPPTPAGPPPLSFVESSGALPKTGTWVGYPLLADFNADGRADLAASNRKEDGFSTWLAPEEPGSDWQLRIGEIPRNLMYGACDSGDLDGDGRPDLALGAHTDGLRSYLNKEGVEWVPSAWTESAAQASNNPNLLLGIKLGHIDQDSYLDAFAVSHFEGGLHIFLGDGKGGFARLARSRDLAPNLGRVFGRCVEIADLNGDEVNDLVATTSSGVKAFFLQHQESLRWEEASAGLPNPQIGNSVYGLATGRFTDHELPQIATCLVPDPGIPPDQRNDIGVYEWDNEAQEWKQIDRGLRRDEAYRDVRAADFDGDGNLDLVVATIQSGVGVYLGDGTGGFAWQGSIEGMHGKCRVAVGDVDGDGRPDIATAAMVLKATQKGGGLRVFLNRL